LIEGMPAAVVGNPTACFFPPPGGPHGTVPISPPGSKTVKIGGRPAARVGDKAACGQEILSGAKKVLIG
jgi:uncharacterized Zn-binding protein involved in type VI secretion